jgi:hypothetical protein
MFLFWKLELAILPLFKVGKASLPVFEAFTVEYQIFCLYLQDNLISFSLTID